MANEGQKQRSVRTLPVLSFDLILQSPLLIREHLIDLPYKLKEAVGVLLFGGFFAQLAPTFFVFADHDAPFAKYSA